MPDKLCLKGSRNPLEMARSLAYKMRFRKEHPDFFDPSGAVKRFHCPQRRSSIGRLSGAAPARARLLREIFRKTLAKCQHFDIM